MTLEQYFSDKHRGAKADLARDLGMGYEDGALQIEAAERAWREAP